MSVVFDEKEIKKLVRGCRAFVDKINERIDALEEDDDDLNRLSAYDFLNYVAGAITFYKTFNKQILATGALLGSKVLTSPAAESWVEGSHHPICRSTYEGDLIEEK